MDNEVEPFQLLTGHQFN